MTNKSRDVSNGQCTVVGTIMDKIHRLLMGIRREKIPTIITTRNWTDFFGSKDLMTMVLPLVHLYDIIHLTQTCRRLYTFYYGSKLKKILCHVVERDTGIKYSASPLQYLGKTRNVVKVKSVDGPIFRAPQCSCCKAKTVSSRYWFKETVKYVLCMNCDEARMKFCYHLSLEDVKRRYEPAYGEVGWARIERILMRHAVKYGRLIQKYSLLGSSNRYCKMEEIRNRMREDLLGQINHLDLEQRLVIRIRFPPRQDFDIVKRERADIIDEQDELKKQRVDNDEL